MLSNGTLSVSLPAQSVTTFVGAVAASGGSDTTPPTAPGTPTADAVTASSVTMSWTASTDDTAVAGYEVVQLHGSTESAAAFSTTNATTIMGLPEPPTPLLYGNDAVGNRSARSATVTATSSTGTPTGGCGIGYQVTGSWTGGCQREIALHNTSATALSDCTRAIPAGGSVSIGFLATQVSTNPTPTSFTINGGTCSTV
jgi:glucuronoarabinoxylan endo-1,4-beta-xylanase